MPTIVAATLRNNDDMPLTRENDQLAFHPKQRTSRPRNIRVDWRDSRAKQQRRTARE
ncbi:MAG: hypothetical protein HKN47_00380 [Pirellulaceae bacterium]|nr:hypothetical protein [Pirellulaceae bacterium]